MVSLLRFIYPNMIYAVYANMHNAHICAYFFLEKNVLGALLVPLPAKIISWVTSDTNIPGHYPKSKCFLFDVTIVIFFILLLVISNKTGYFFKN